MNNREEWEEVLSRLTREQDSEKRPTASSVGGMLSGIIAFCILNSISAVALMVLNTTLIRAWPNMTAIAPGIGYWDAFAASGLVWLLFLLKFGLVMGVSSHGRN